MKLYKILLSLLLFFAVAHFCHTQTDGFTIQKISSDLACHEEWQTEPLNQEEKLNLEGILGQKFHYLSAGGSCYVFESDDGQSVIKFFKHHHLNPMAWMQSWPLISSFYEYIKTHFAQQKKIQRVFLSVKCAFVDLKEETGLLYIHLNKTKNLHKNLVIVDKLGIEHHLVLDSMEFIVQKKAELVCDHIAGLMQKNDLKGAKEALSGILHLMIDISQKGYYDHDPNIATNFGFIADRSVKVDVGPFIPVQERKNDQFPNKKFFKSTLKFKEWLEDRYPELAKEFESQVNKITQH